MNQISTSAHAYGNCDKCGDLLFENLVHACSTVMRSEAIKLLEFPAEPPTTCSRCGGAHAAIECAQGRFVEFTVHGKAQPAGSKKGFYNKKLGRVIITDAAKKSRPWKAIVTDAALEVMDTAAPLSGPLRASFSFYETRPKSHFNTKGGLNATGLRNPFPAKRPDVLKLARAVEDAMSTVVYADDSQIVQEHLLKAYADWEGVVIRVEELES